MPNIGEFVGNLLPVDLAGGGASSRACLFSFDLVFGAAGAVASTPGLPPGAVVTNPDTGEYQVAFPSVKRVGLNSVRFQPVDDTAGNRHQAYGEVADGPTGIVFVRVVAADGSGTGDEPEPGSKLTLAGVVDYT